MRASRENRFLMMTNQPNVTFLARTFICIVAGLNLLAIYAFLGNIFARGSKVSWNGYKLHIDTADCGVPVSALLSSASMHDSLAAVPLSRISAKRIDSLYDLMDAAYCSLDLHEHCRELGHIPIIDHNPRQGLKEEFNPNDAIRYRERSGVERTNARLKDEFGGRNVMVRGARKVFNHLMFGLLVLSVDQLIRLFQLE